jgi:beta-galactosidase
MPSVSYDGQSFLINGRRTWLCGASIPYALVPPEEWKRAIGSVAEAGFNVVETSVPWLLHEPRPGRFIFSGQLDLRRFIDLCGDAGLRVLLRAGPYIGGTIDGGGLPPWLAEVPGMMIRQGSEPFLERTSLFFHRLFEPLVDLQVTRPQPSGRDGGPILLVQLEQAWRCANDEQGRKYLQELVRYARECGLTVPLLTANDLWQDVEGTIESWSGARDLLVDLRQLRAVQSHAPRLVTSFDPSSLEVWGEPELQGPSRDEVMLRMAQVLAAGGQPLISPFHPAANLGFLSGRLTADEHHVAATGASAEAFGRFVATRPALDAPLDESGERGPKYAALKRMASFATSFGHVFTELDPDHHPIVVDVESMTARPRGGRSGKGGVPSGGAQLSVVPLLGTQGRIVFVFTAEGAPRHLTLLLENGVRMPVELGDQPVGWFVLDLDLLGSGHLDYCNLCPILFVDRTILVVQGPAKAQALLSINGGSLEATVPAGTGQPLVVDHKGITVVICNQEQIDATYHDGEHVYVGCRGFDGDGRPILDPTFPKVWRVGRGGDCKPAPSSVQEKAHPAPVLGPWAHASARALVDGSSQRFATLDGPASLCACGAPHGYGWYRVRLSTGGRKRTLLPSEGGDRMHLYSEGSLQRIVGAGPAATPPPFDARGAGESTLVFLADNLGRFSEGNDAGERTGLPGPLLDVKPLKGAKMKRVEAPPADPFKLRGFIAQRAVGQLGSTSQTQWTFLHRRKSKIAVFIQGLRSGGTLVLNDTPLAYYAGVHGRLSMVVTIDPATTKGFKPGTNHLRFSPDPPSERSLAAGMPKDDPAKAIHLYEVQRVLGGPATDGGHWSFARWETPETRQFHTEGKVERGIPCWWRSEFSIRHAQPLWLLTAGLSKGAVLLNGRVLGRYYTATQTGKGVGPQKSVYIPAPWLRLDGLNELVIFDEHGFSPSGAKLSNKA